MGDDEWIEGAGLLCQPVRAGDAGVFGSQVRWCVRCGSEVYVAPSALRQVDSGRVQPRCFDHDIPDDAELMGPTRGQRGELRAHGVNSETVDEAARAARAYFERRRRS